MQPYKMKSLANCDNEKLILRFYEPFEIKEKIGSATYRLELPTMEKYGSVIYRLELSIFYDSQIKLVVYVAFPCLDMTPRQGLHG